MAAKKAPAKKAGAKKVAAKKGERRAMLDQVGIDAICDMFAAGKMQRQIARECGVIDTVLVKWLASSEERSARAREARAKGAFVWDEMALEEIQSLPDDATPGQIARAREIASHYRWRASKLGRAEYGEKLEHGGEIKTTLPTFVLNFTGETTK